MIVLIVFVFAIVFDNAVADHFDRLSFANATQAELLEIEAIQDLWRPQHLKTVDNI